MSEEKQQELYKELKDALDEVPKKYHKYVARSMTFGLELVAQTIRLMEAQET